MSLLIVVIIFFLLERPSSKNTSPLSWLVHNGGKMSPGDNLSPVPATLCCQCERVLSCLNSDRDEIWQDCSSKVIIMD